MIELERADRGQVGIGTLIVFIAMVLVAAIAAGVLVDTAGFLQSKAQQTGEQSTDKVTNRVEVLSTYGIVHQLDPVNEDSANPGDGNDWYTSADGDNSNGNYLIDELNFVMMRSAGSDNIKLDKVVLMWQGPDGADQITLGSPGSDYAVSVNDVTGASDNVLNEDADRAKVTLTLDPKGDGSGNKKTAFDALATGETVTVRFTTVSGATVTKVISTPSTYPSNDGEVIEL
jgi:flagellin-like protein